VSDALVGESRPILVATDFSADSEAAFAWALEAASAFGAPLHVVHVVHDPLERPGAYARKANSSLEHLEDVARDMLETWIERRLASQATAAERPEVASSVVVGLPETRILEVAALEQARMIVMGGQGRTGLAEILLGHRAERVARLATIPVTIVRSAAPKEASSAETDGSNRTRTAR
jgi:nucleotide-binding universal stress UspA family protein